MAPPQLDAYEVLGVAENATAEEIHDAYVERIKQVHPDVRPELGHDGHVQTVALNLALEILSSPLARAALDRRRRQQREPRVEWVPFRPRPKPQRAPPPYAGPPPGWRVSAKGNYWKKVDELLVTVFQHRRGWRIGMWGYIIDGEFGEDAYPTSAQAIRAAEQELRYYYGVA